MIALHTLVQRAGIDMATQRLRVRGPLQRSEDKFQGEHAAQEAEAEGQGQGQGQRQGQAHEAEVHGACP